jgi:carboxymethylenebutenolidase
MTIKDDLVEEISTPSGSMRTCIFRPAEEGRYPGIVLYSEIFQVTAPIRRTAAFLAGHGYVVAVPGADKGNEDKYAKQLSSYDADARAILDHLKARADCTGKLGAAGICLGGHLAFRAAMNADVLATVCFYATDIHAGSLGKGKKDNSLERAAEIKGELLHIWGRQDPHVPLEGRNRIKARLDEAGVNFQWLEVNGAHAFMRDEGYRYDPALAYLCQGMMLELFRRKLC